MKTARTCLECSTQLAEGATSRRKYCSEKCRDRVKKRRRRSATGSETELSRLKRQLVEENTRIRVLESRLDQRTAEREDMKEKRHKERLRAGRIQRDIDRARATVGAELKDVRRLLAQREHEAAATSHSEAESVEVTRLRRQNRELREDLSAAQQVAYQLRGDMVEERRLSNSLTDEVEQYHAIAQRMKIKSEAMFTVFAHWNELAGDLFESRDGQGETELEQAIIDFWAWMHTRQSHLFRKGYIETSLEDELTEIDQ